MSAPFAIHPLDKRRAKKYRDAAVEAGLTWSDTVQHFEAYADKERWNDAKRSEEIARVRKYMSGKIKGAT